MPTIGLNKWHEYLKISLSSCTYCKEEAKKIEEYYKELRAEARRTTGDNFEHIYHSSPEDWKHIVLRPDFNSAGCLTHWHIELDKSDKERKEELMEAELRGEKNAG